jgi:hypothetical protein
MGVVAGGVRERVFLHFPRPLMLPIVPWWVAAMPPQKRFSTYLSGIALEERRDEVRLLRRQYGLAKG